MRRSRRVEGDRGAYAVLYAVIMVVLIGMAALVIDLGTLRMDRRTDRAATDAGALAGSSKLGIGGTSPIAACTAAMRYAEATLSLGVGADTCASAPPNGFQGSAAALCVGAPIHARRLAGDRTIVVSWPVPDDSSYLGQPDMERRGQDTEQKLTAQDGARCSRLAVRIEHRRTAIFSAVWPDLGVDRATVSSSVGLAVADDGAGDLPAPLVVLEKRQCKSLDVTGSGTGTGGVLINASALLPDGSRSPGHIHVDSAASAGAGENDFGVSCQSGGSAPINVAGNNKAWTLDGLDANGLRVPGLIGSYAMANGRAAYSDQTSVAGCPLPSAPFNPPATGAPPSLCRLPTTGGLVGPAPWVVRYNCGASGLNGFGYTGGCPDRDPPAAPYPAPRNYVDQWRSYAEGTVPQSFTGQIPSATVTCNAASGTFTNLLADCPTLKVTGNLAVTGSFVARGNVQVTNGACLLLGTDALGTCAVLPDAVTVPAPADGRNAYIRGALDVGGAFIARQTFVYVGGRLTMNPDRIVSWTGPYGSGSAGSPPCVPATSATTGPSPSCFEDLSMWSPYAGKKGGSTQNGLTASARVKVDGTLFMPAAYFTFTGQADNTQERAQFVARSLNVTGGGLLTMTPDATRSTPIPGVEGRLIR